MRLRFIEQVDFRKSEQTNYQEWAKRNRVMNKRLDADDALCFINHGENQLVFVHGFEELESNYPKRKIHVLASRRLRISGGKWNPLRLTNYAEMVGLKLVGLKDFADFYKELRS
jgi:hypothetical protein